MSEEAETEYVAFVRHGWGRGEHEQEAVKEALKQLCADNLEAVLGYTVRVKICRVRGFQSVNGMGHLRADEFLGEDTLAVSKERLVRAVELMDEADLQVDTALGEADEVVEGEVASDG